MLGFFPDFNPNELFYSACARYKDRAHFRNKCDVSELLFGRRHLTAWIHLPQYLDLFVASLHPRARYTSDYIIYNHTTLPYLIPFVSPERIQQAWADMKGGGGKVVLNNLGVHAGRILLPDRLRFCPQCAENDRSTLGERYWHRLHQLPGVEVCPKHAVFLEDSDVRTRYRVTSNEYVSAERAAVTALTRPVDLYDPIQQSLMRIAHDTKWLLDQQSLLLGGQSLVAGYLKVLTANGLATRSGFVRQEKLSNFLAERCPPKLWSKFRGMNGRPNNWEIKILSRIKKGRTVHPLLHLLLIHALGHTAEEFFGECASLAGSVRENSTAPFGEGPWPCLNRTSRHYRQPTVYEYRLTYTREPNSRPMGIFMCDCGFTYVRIGPEASAEDRYRLRRVESYGTFWEATLTKLWADPSLSKEEIGRRVGLGSWDALKKQASRLKLPFPRVGPKGLEGRSGPGHVSVYFYKHAPGPQALTVYRREWLEGMKQKPQVTTTKALIQDKALALVYRRLLKHDPQWLGRNSPKGNGFALAPTLADRNEEYWKQLDDRMAPEVEHSAQRIREKQGRPLRISRTEIARELGMNAQIFRQLDKLPKTAETLAKYVETCEEAAVRRIHWAGTQFREEGITPSKTMLMKKARVKAAYWMRETIQRAADETLRRLTQWTIAL